MTFMPTRYQHIPTCVLLLFCGYVIEWYLQLGYRKPELGAIRFEFIYAAGLSLIALYYTTASSYKCPLTKYLILYFFVVIIQVPFSYNFDYSWDIFVDRIIKFAFMAWFIITFVKSPRGLVFFICAFMLACMKMGQEGLVGQITGNLVWQNQGVMRLHGATPNYAHPNSFSGMAIGTLPFIIAFFPIVNKYIKALLVVQAVFAFNIIIFTGSRTGYVATVLLVLFAIYKSKINKLKLIIVIAAIAFVSVNYIPSEYLGRFESIYNPEKEIEGHSTEARKEILKDAWAIFLDHPFGIGVGAFPFIRRDVFGRTQDTHNLYMEIATNLGIQGLIVFVVFVYSMLTLLNRIRLSTRKKIKEFSNSNKINLAGEQMRNELTELIFIEATALAAYLFIIVRLALGLFGMDLYEIYWWFASGLTIALYNMNMVINPKSSGLHEG